jgi:glycosyltransferase involved in cell wall biosynthesis
MSRPSTISIVIPTLNGARFLTHTLDSLASQSLAPHEVIVVDDGSVDASRSIAERHPIVSRVIGRKHSAGVAYARNAGVAVATGEFVALLDHDDMWAPHRCIRIGRYLDAHPDCEAIVTTCTPFVHSTDTGSLRARGDRLHEHARPIDDGDERSLHADDDGSTPPCQRMLDRRDLMAGPPSVTVSYVIQRDLYLAAGGCAPLARSMDDWLMLQALSMSTEIHVVDEPSLLYRVHPTSTTMATDWSLPLLAAALAGRHGGNLVPAGQSRNATLVPAVHDDRRFLWHHLLEVARHDRVWDALAAAQLLAVSRHDRRAAQVAILKTAFKRRLSR